MSKKDPLSDLQHKLAELQEEEKHLKVEMKVLAEDIQKKATPLGIAKGVVSGMFKDRSGTAANTATAALGIGAGLLANNLLAKKRGAAMIGKLAALAVGFAVNKIAERRNRKAAQKATLT